MPANHYENFPVASMLLPTRLREPVAAIYGFARSADDFADEGELGPAERLALLAGYQSELDAIEAARPTGHPLFVRLRAAIDHHQLPLAPFRDLLDAFSQDVRQARYRSFVELMDYCRRSADPVGRLLLRLFQADTPENIQCSDAICSALQLINHWQDVAIDWSKGRVYLPQEDLERFGVDEKQIATGTVDERWRALMAFQGDRARALMLTGSPLGHVLTGRIGMEIRAIVAGGLRVLEMIEAVGYDVFRHRPVLARSDWLRIFWAAL